MGKYQTVDDYINDQDEWKGKIIFQLRELVKKSAPNSREVIKWSQPVYEDDNGPFCFIKAHKNHVNFGFWRGAIIKDPRKILEGDGVKMRHIKYFQDTKIDTEIIADFVKQALILNNKLGDPSK
jgi:hypothetical protein